MIIHIYTYTYTYTYIYTVKAKHSRPHKDNTYIDTNVHTKIHTYMRVQEHKDALRFSIPYFSTQQVLVKRFDASGFIQTATSVLTVFQVCAYVRMYVPT